VVPLDVADPRTDDPATRAALAAVAAMPRSLRTEVARATATTDQDVTLTLADGTTVLWGDAADSPRKASVLAALLGQVKSGKLDGAKTIDVSAPSAVVLR
jgi:cell division protein FtsQ